MYVTPKQVIIASWILFALYWLIASFGVKRTVKRQDPAERLLYVVFMAAGFFLLYQENPNWGPLNRRFVSDELWIAWLGSALSVAGVLFAIWARRTIGKDWSAEVQIKEGHELIRSGPYARIRHPIYTGILLATIAPVPTRFAFSLLRPVCTGRSCPLCPTDSLRRSKVLLPESGSSRTGIRPTCIESAERWISCSSFPLTKTAQKQIKGRNYSLMMARKKAWREISGEAVGENTSK